VSSSNLYLKRQGANFLSIINDLKRNRQAAADDLDIPLAQIEAIIAGDMDIPADVLDRAVRLWPVNRRDFMIIDDDAPAGVRVMRRSASEASSRVFARGGVPYYEYRDTAMSKLAPLRPEWILELVEVDDDDPASPQVQWNHGHFMHQFTMFVNAVNFYYMENGERKVMKANTGDSMYITPFVPHSFATRRGDAERLYGGRKGLILALTYGNKVAGDVQHELSALGGDLPPRFLLDTSSREQYCASLLRQQLDAASMTPADAARRASIADHRMSEFVSGRAMPTAEEYRRLADAFTVNSRDLMPPDEIDPKVVTRTRAGTPSRRFGRYCVTDMAGIRYLPYSKALLVDVEGPDGGTDLDVPLHQYCYNLGERPITITWRANGTTHQDVLNRDDSVYVKPHVPHGFSTPGARGTMVSLRVAGKTPGDPQRELSHIGAENIRRTYLEHSLWYREEKKQ
jgi:methylphosphonate synthase